MGGILVKFTVMNKIERIFQESSDVGGFATGYFRHLSDVLGKINPQSIENFLKLIEAARERGSQIFFIGNGGSAATCSHFANDLAIGTRSWEKPYRALSLCDNLAVVTAIANDSGYDQVFVQQLQALLKPNDVVVAFSASGNSPNLLKALDTVHALGGISVGFTGFDGGKLKLHAQHSVHVPSDKGEYGPVEDAHLIVEHLVSNYLMLSARQAAEVYTPPSFSPVIRPDENAQLQ